MKHPSAWYVGDKATVQSGDKRHHVTIEGFRDHLVCLEYADGTKGMRPFTALEAPDTIHFRTYSTLLGQAA